MKDVEEEPRELVVSRCDRAIDLQMADHALDAVAITIEALVPANFGFACCFGWDAGADTGGVQRGADGIGVVAFVGKQLRRPLVGEGHHVFERRAVGRFARREMEDEREPSGVTETMNFTGEPAPRPAKSLFASPPFAPAAET